MLQTQRYCKLSASPSGPLTSILGRRHLLGQVEVLELVQGRHHLLGQVGVEVRPLDLQVRPLELQVRPLEVSLDKQVCVEQQGAN